MELKTYLVIGASGSVGNKVTELLRKNGHRVIISSSKKTNRLDDNFIYLDLTDHSSIAELNEFTKRLDGVIFAAGYEPKQSILEMSLEHQIKCFKFM